MLEGGFRDRVKTALTSVADLAVGDLVANLNDLANDLVANAKREGSITPTTSDGVEIGSANTASLNGNIDIVLLELLELELALLEVRPRGRHQSVSSYPHSYCHVLTTSCGRGS